MAVLKNLFVNLDDNLDISVQLLDVNGAPLVLDDYLVEFATAKEQYTDAIEILTSANTAQIEVVSESSAIIKVKLQPTEVKGYIPGQHAYQLRVTNTGANTNLTYLEGKLYINPSIFN